MAHTGIGLAQDAATLYFNPAGLSFVGNQVNVGVSGIMPRVQFLDANTNISTYADNQFFTPFSLYANYHLGNSPITLGLGIYTPFGSGVKYPTNWTGRYVLTNINLQAVYFQPTAAFKISDNISNDRNRTVFAFISAIIKSKLLHAALKRLSREEGVYDAGKDHFD